MANKTRLIGQNYQTPDLVAKVTGRAKYAEDYRAEGMLFCKVLLSPMPHARVKSIDASAALKLPGVAAVLTADEIPVVAPPARGLAAREEEGPEGRANAPKTNVRNELALTNEPMYHGDPILAVAAVDETTAADAIELIEVEYEPLPFCVDPLESLRPGGPNARLEGNVWNGIQAETFKFTPEQWKEVEAGRLPFCETPDMWQAGDVEAGFKEADLIIDETVVHQSVSTRHSSRAARWRTGRTASCTCTVPPRPLRTSPRRWDDGRGERPERRCVYQRVLRRRVWRQEPRAHDAHGDSGPPVQEDRQAGDDARQPGGRPQHRTQSPRPPHAREDRVPKGRPHHRDGPADHPERRCVHPGRATTEQRRPRPRSATRRSTFGSAVSRCSPTHHRLVLNAGLAANSAT